MSTTKRDDDVIRPALVSGSAIFYLLMVVLVKVGAWPDLSWWWVTLPLWIGPAVYLTGCLLMAILQFTIWINISVRRRGKAHEFDRRADRLTPSEPTAT